MTLACDRTLAIVEALETDRLAVTADEIEELLARGLVVESEPEDLALAAWLEATVRNLLGQSSLEPGVVLGLEQLLTSADKDLKNDWYRMTTSRAVLDEREAQRVTVRRALGLARDPALQEALRSLAQQSRILAPQARYVACPALGFEVYALTRKGDAVARALQARLARVGPVPLKTFLASFEKIDAKMTAFAGDLRKLDNGIGFVKKNRHQVVIGLAKTGLDPHGALRTYGEAVKHVGAPDVAVTCARNAATSGSPGRAAARLREAEQALRQTGLPISPMLLGAAKSLLAFDPPSQGVARFVAMKRGLDRAFHLHDVNHKYAARLMPASGTPDEVMARVVATTQALLRHRGRLQTPESTASLAVAIAAMVRNASMIEPAVLRQRELEDRLSKAKLATVDQAPDLALECMASPGTPEEIVETVRALADHVSEGTRTPAHVATAVAFAKRFAY